MSDTLHGWGPKELCLPEATAPCERSVPGSERAQAAPQARDDVGAPEHPARAPTVSPSPRHTSGSVGLAGCFGDPRQAGESEIRAVLESTGPSAGVRRGRGKQGPNPGSGCGLQQGPSGLTHAAQELARRPSSYVQNVAVADLGAPQTAAPTCRVGPSRVGTGIQVQSWRRREVSHESCLQAQASGTPGHHLRPTGLTLLRPSLRPAGAGERATLLDKAGPASGPEPSACRTGSPRSASTVTPRPGGSPTAHCWSPQIPISKLISVDGSPQPPPSGRQTGPLALRQAFSRKEGQRQLFHPGLPLPWRASTSGAGRSADWGAPERQDTSSFTAVVSSESRLLRPQCCHLWKGTMTPPGVACPSPGPCGTVQPTGHGSRAASSRSSLGPALHSSSLGLAVPRGPAAPPHSLLLRSGPPPFLPVVVVPRSPSQAGVPVPASFWACGRLMAQPCPSRVTSPEPAGVPSSQAAHEVTPTSLSGGQSPRRHPQGTRAQPLPRGGTSRGAGVCRSSGLPGRKGREKLHFLPGRRGELWRSDRKQRGGAGTQDP